MNIRESLRRALRFVDPAYIVLVVGLLVFGGWNVRLAIERRALVRQVSANQPGLSGAATCQVGDLVPAITTVTADGVPTLVSYDGPRRHLLFIFDPRCGVCEHDSPLWKQLSAEAASKGLLVRWVSLAPAAVTKAAEARFASQTDLVLMPDFGTQRAYRVTSVPQVLIVSPAGRVEWVHNGALSDRLRESLRLALGPTGMSDASAAQSSTSERTAAPRYCGGMGRAGAARPQALSFRGVRRTDMRSTMLGKCQG
jgi:hypothetical protein